MSTTIYYAKCASISGKTSISEKKTSIRSFILKILVNCKAGNYRDENQIECQKCVGNTMSEAGASFCTECPEGTLANADKTQCGKLISMRGYVITLHGDLSTFLLGKNNNLSSLY